METHPLDLQKKLEMPWLLASQLALALASQRASAPSHWIEGKILTGNHGFPHEISFRKYAQQTAQLFYP
jgi:hypothetical protein